MGFMNSISPDENFEDIALDNLAAPKRPAVYIDPQRFPNEFARQLIYSYYEQNYAAHLFDFIDFPISNLDHETPFRSKFAEQSFASRGFLSTIECAVYTTGRNTDQLRIYRHAQSVVCHQLVKIAAFSDHFRRKRNPKENWKRILGYLIGQYEGKSIPLVKRSSMFIPWRTFNRKESVHLAYSKETRAALEDGLDDQYGLTYATESDIFRQVAFESDHSRQIFNGASREALFFWQTQVLALLRKAAFAVNFAAGRLLHDAEAFNQNLRPTMLEIADLYGPGAIDWGDLAFDDPSYIAFETVVNKSKLDEDALYGPKYFYSNFSRRLDEKSVLIAALNGSTYKTAEVHEPGKFKAITSLGFWLGELKRHRFKMMSADIAEWIVYLSTASSRTDKFSSACQSYEKMLRERLGAASWDALVYTAHQVQQGAAPVSIRYEWTRDHRVPRQVQTTDQGLVLTGPLLDFALEDAAALNRRMHLQRSRVRMLDKWDEASVWDDLARRPPKKKGNELAETAIKRKDKDNIKKSEYVRQLSFERNSDLIDFKTIRSCKNATK